MGSRWILFGYKIVNEKYIIVPHEAETVKKIFNLYISGTSLQTIADILTREQIHYSSEKSVWNKNMIARIIENAHYVGDLKYPQIIEQPLFNNAVVRKNTIGGKREKDSDEIKYLKSVLYCSECKGRIRRIASYTYREKWICENHCKNVDFLDDALLFNKIIILINTVISNPNMLDVIAYVNKYEPDLDTIRRINELKYMIDQGNTRFVQIKNELFDCVSRKFNCCQLDISTYTEPIKEYIAGQKSDDKLNIDLLSKIIDKIYINTDGSITIKFINGIEIDSMGKKDSQDADATDKNNYKN